MKDNGPIIRIKDADVILGDKLILEKITLSVDRGQFVAIIGPNGAGKTTLFKVILGLIPAESGTVELFGKNPEKLGSDRHRLAYVPQIRSVDMQFPLKVKNAVLMGRYARLGLLHSPRGKDREIAWEMMEKTGVADLAEKPINKLSGGQMQRVFIARALTAQPDILFLDEPTNGVDQFYTSSFYDLLKDLHREQMTILMVSHDVGVVAGFVDTVACLNRRLIVHGKPQEVLSAHTLEEMYGCEASFLHHCQAPNMFVKQDH